jgi:hypothetical protein
MNNRRRTTAVVLSLTLTGLLAACSATLDRIGVGGGSGASSSSSSETQTVQAGAQDQIRLSDYYGSGYCPTIEVRDGTQVIRKYVNYREPTQDTLVWQAAISETARQCKEAPDGTMTLKIGVSGRVLAGPKGGPADVTVPIRVAVVKFQESVLSSELHKETVTIGPQLSTVFRRIYNVTVPSPGDDRDYLIYIGFDGGKETQGG